jgi:hypothetical protein
MPLDALREERTAWCSGYSVRKSRRHLALARGRSRVMYAPMRCAA